MWDYRCLYEILSPININVCFKDESKLELEEGNNLLQPQVFSKQSWRRELLQAVCTRDSQPIGPVVKCKRSRISSCSNHAVPGIPQTTFGNEQGFICKAWGTMWYQKMNLGQALARHAKTTVLLTRPSKQNANLSLAFLPFCLLLRCHTCLQWPSGCFLSTLLRFHTPPSTVQFKKTGSEIVKQLINTLSFLFSRNALLPLSLHDI